MRPRKYSCNTIFQRRVFISINGSDFLSTFFVRALNVRTYHHGLAAVVLYQTLSAHFPSRLPGVDGHQQHCYGYDDDHHGSFSTPQSWFELLPRRF